MADISGGDNLPIWLQLSIAIGTTLATSLAAFLGISRKYANRADDDFPKSNNVREELRSIREDLRDNAHESQEVLLRISANTEKIAQVLEQLSRLTHDEFSETKIARGVDSRLSDWIRRDRT